MNQKTRIAEMAKEALRAGEARKVEVLRYFLSLLQKRELELPPGEMEEKEVLQVLQKEAKKKEEAKVMFAKAGRDDLVKELEEELVILGQFLPESLGETEVEKIIREERAKGGEMQFGELMRAAMGRLQGRADGRVVSGLVKKVLDEQEG